LGHYSRWRRWARSDMAKQKKPWFRAAKGTWYATVGGRQVSLGVQGEDNEEAAFKAWHKKMAEEGECRTKPKRAATVGQVIDAFLEDVKDRVKPNTVRVYDYFLKPFKAKHAPVNSDDRAPPVVEKYARGMGWSDTTRSNFTGAVVSAFRYGVRAKMIDRSPLDGVRAPKRQSRGKKALISEEDHARLLEKATPTFSLFLRVIHATGARPGEVAAITADNFDEAGACVRLEEHKTREKTGKDRAIYLTPETVALLKKQKEKCGTGHLLRTAYGRPWKPVVLVRSMAATRKKAGVKGATLYGYRHSLATDALASGVPDAHVAELLGHSGTRMLHQHYSHLSGKANILREALGQVRGSSRGEA
jgi:integrase/recombinase XerC